MKWTLLLFIFLLTACSQLSRFPAEEKVVRHVVLDIDWTIVSEVKVDNAPIKAVDRIIEVEGHKYFINEGVEEFIENILDKKDVMISFYSGGTQSRNLELLSKIKLKDDSSLKDIAYKILSFEDLVPTEAPVNALFVDRFKKDLSKISLDLDQLIMFDDTFNFVLNTQQNQSEHVFFMGSSFLYFENFKDTKGFSGKYVPSNYSEWLLNNKKFYILRGAFDEAYAESKNGAIGLALAMKKQEELLNFKARTWNDYSTRFYKKYFQTDSSIKPQGKFNCVESMKSIVGF